jgi:hypothetical protein
MLLPRLFSLPAQAALSHVFLRILVLLLVEGECARLVQQSSGKPAVLINFILIGIYSMAFVLAVAKTSIGYLIGIFAGVINIMLKITVVFMGHEHFPNRPYLYIFQSLVVTYFCYVAYKDTAKQALS